MHAQANAAPPATAAADGAMWRAWIEGSHRDEAAGHALHAPKLIQGRCPRCRVSVSVGATVVIRHLPGCAVAAVKAAAFARARRTGRAVCPATVSAPAACSVPSRASAPPEDGAEPDRGQSDVPAVADVRPAMRHRNRHGRRSQGQEHGRGCGTYTTASPGFEPDPFDLERESKPQDGIRPWVVLRWFVSGCRVVVQGWVATVRGVIRRKDGKLKARLDFDDWPRNVHSEVPEWWALDYLIEPESASVAA